MKAPLASKDGLFTWWAEEPPAYVVPVEVMAAMEDGEPKIIGNMRRRSYTSEAAALQALAAAECKIQQQRRNPAPIILGD